MDKICAGKTLWRHGSRVTISSIQKLKCATEWHEESVIQVWTLKKYGQLTRRRRCQTLVGGWRERRGFSQGSWSHAALLWFPSPSWKDADSRCWIWGDPSKCHCKEATSQKPLNLLQTFTPSPPQRNMKSGSNTVRGQKSKLIWNDQKMFSLFVHTSGQSVFEESGIHD